LQCDNRLVQPRRRERASDHSSLVLPASRFWG
jgi:hypothetical protein